MTRFDYSGKHVFVAGGTSGINFAIARAFAEAGAKVSVISRSQDKVDHAVAELQSYGAAFGAACDVRDAAKVDSTIKEAVAAFGGVDILVSGAAGNFPAPAMGISPNGFKAVIDIDVLGTFHVVRAAFPHLKKPGACVINISAPQAYNAMELQMHVCAAKAGVDMITRVAAMEWGPLGVRVNSISPGPIDDTEGMNRLAPTPEARDATTASIPMGRFGKKQEIADACLWLASPMASYVTGVVLPVDGGWSLTGSSVRQSMLKEMVGGST